MGAFAYPSVAVAERGCAIRMHKDDEQILVIKSEILFSPQGGIPSAGKNKKWQGLKTDNLDYYINLIKKNCEFRRRGDMENNPFFQQIIPYVLFSFGSKFFAYRYLKNAGEKRLINNDYQLGVGGHINQKDLNEKVPKLAKGEPDLPKPSAGTPDVSRGRSQSDPGNILEVGMMREWNEEVNFKGNLINKKLIGIINDESRPVERVHIGLVYHFVGDSPDIQVKETDKMEGVLLDLKELSEGAINCSPWMQIVYDQYLSKICSKILI